ncbi:response regulator [Paraburkholderia strydomiana]|nr:response regulator [Paraburkholderia strydomiana]
MLDINYSSYGLEGQRVLVVEDDYMVAQAVMALLEDAGIHVVGPIGWVDEVLSFLGEHADAFDCAVLDVDLHGETSYPVMDALAARGIRFVLTTGYGADALDSRYSHYARCEKPIDRDLLFRALAPEGN